MTPRQPATAGELRRAALVVAPLTAAALIAQQVASNAVRDARLRCGRALLALTDNHPELTISPPVVYAAVERELTGATEDGAVREHVFNLLSLVQLRGGLRALDLDGEG